MTSWKFPLEPNQFKGGYRKPKMIGITVKLQESGKTVKMKIRKNIPTKCKTPKRICIKCAVTVISKHSNRYESKICENCE